MSTLAAQTMTVLVFGPVLAVLLVVALRREAVTVEARRKSRARDEQMRRGGMAGMGVAAGHAATAMRGFADAIERTHRTTARPAHRAPRGQRA